MRHVLDRALLAVLLGLAPWVARGAEGPAPATDLAGQIAAAEEELKKDGKDLFELKDVFTKKKEAKKDEKPLPPAVQARVAQEWEFAKGIHEFAQQALERAKVAPNPAKAQVELKDALDKAQSARDWKRRAESALAPAPPVAPPHVRSGTWSLASEAWNQAVAIEGGREDFDRTRRPPPQAVDAVNYDPNSRVLTTSSGTRVPVGPFDDAVQRVLPERSRRLNRFVSVPTPDGPRVQLNPEVAKALASPEAQAELNRVGGVALDVTLDLLSYAGVAGFRQRGPATVVESPVLLSLACLHEKVRPFAASPEVWEGLPEDLRYPAAIERVHGFVLDPKSQDVFLIASRAQAPENRMDVDALIVALRCVWAEGATPSVSLDPLPGRPAGPQYSRVNGVPLQTTFARIMLDADYAMKRILFGDLDVGVPRFREIDRDMAERGAADSTSGRYWLTPMPLSDRDVHVSPSYRSVLFDSGVRCLTESQNASSEWTGKADEWRERKAQLFTESYERIERSPAVTPSGVLVRLHGLVDLVTICKILRDLGVDYPVLKGVGELPLRRLRGAEAVPPYYHGLSVVFAKKRLSDREVLVLTHNGGAILRGRVTRRSLDLYQDVATATLEHEVDVFPRGQTFTKVLQLPLTLRKARSDDRGGAEYALLAAQTLLRKGEHEPARARLAEIAAADPLHADAWAWLAEALSLAGRHEEATNAINKAIELEPRDYLLKGMEYRILSRAGRTPEDLKLSADLARYLSSESVCQAFALLAQGRSADAAKEIACALGLWRENPDAYLLRAMAANDETSDEAMRDRAEAIRLYEQQIKEGQVPAEMCRRRSAFVHLLEASARSKKLQADVLRDLRDSPSFQEAWKRKPDKMNGLLIDLFGCVSEAKQAQAQDDLDGVAPAVHARLLASMMIVVFAGGNPVDKGLGEAAELSKSVVKRFPDLPDGHYARAFVASTEIAVVDREMKTPGLYNDKERAILLRVMGALLAEIFERLDTAVRLDPTYGEAFLFRAQMHAHVRQGPKALADLQKAKTLLPSVDPAIEAMIRKAAGPEPPAKAPGDAGASVFQVRLVVQGPADDAERMTLVQPGRDPGQTQEEVLHVKKEVLLDGSAVKAASVMAGPASFGPTIVIDFTDDGRKRFAEITRQNIDKRLALIIDGRVCAAPVVRTEISGGAALISGSFSEQEAKDLAAKINKAVAR